MRFTFLLTALVVFGEVAYAQLANFKHFPITNEKAINQRSFFAVDTMDTSGILKAGEEGDSLPLAANPGKLSRPRFESFHLVLGIGGMVSKLSELEKLGADDNNLSIPFLVYVYVPFLREDPSFYFTGGWEMAVSGGRTSFKAFFLYQNRYMILMGLGFGRSWFSYESDDLIIDASQSYPLLAIGMNLDPQRVDLLLTVPIASSLQTTFEGASYHIRPAGIQLSLLVSLRE